MDQIKPSFEEVEDHEDNKSSNQNIKEKEKKILQQILHMQCL